ncbi:alpha/beta-hydrolase [Macrolepiota fuliginosa MF-IS2]|uniref:Alpha/beta-hydrolase n=1 Tax=Macrolepiota fuliginosa MF-IS2 TaxID=1400762 RepID=A0A9P5XJX5_9AGAR|nr:alpha/beta-hydrolase [Macrolepiota fuliginosa MF-IS2]
MLYDKSPTYPHYDHLPYAKEPWKALYVVWRLLTTIALVPVWALTYSVLPLHRRPRESWSLRQIIHVNFIRRIFKVTEVAGVTWQTRDPTRTPHPRSLRETRFTWVDPLPIPMRTGVVDGDAEFKRVGCYIWPKEEPIEVTKKAKVDSDFEGLCYTLPISISSSNSNEVIPNSSQANDEDGEVPLVGIFMHGGGYCHMSAHESASTSQIPSGLIEKRVLHEIYSVEYRLLQIAPFPAVVQDAAAVYTHVVEQYGFRQNKCKIILIGDSSGGNLVLSLTRWLRDEGHLPLPSGLLLLSPSCDPSHAIPETLSSFSPRPNAHTDYLVDTPEPRALMLRTFLGLKHEKELAFVEEERRLMNFVHSEYVSPCSPIVLKRWGHNVMQDIEGIHTSHIQNLPSAIRLANDPNNVISIPEASSGKSPRFTKLFGDFPKTLVVLGDAERLVREVKSLVVAMEKDGVDVQLHVAPDAVHDILIISKGWWDKKTIRDTWTAVVEWGKKFR